MIASESATAAPVPGGSGTRRLPLQEAAQPSERARLELTNALAGHAHPVTHLLERLLLRAVESEAPDQDLALAQRQGRQGALDPADQVVPERFLLGRRDHQIRHELAERGVLADGRVERQR